MIQTIKRYFRFVAVGAVLLASCGRPAPTSVVDAAAAQFEQFVSIEIKSEDIDLFRSALANYAAISRAEAGSVRYDVYQSLDKPALFAVHETWQSADAHTAHLNSAKYQAYSAEVSAYFAAPVVRQLVN